MKYHSKRQAELTVNSRHGQHLFSLCYNDHSPGEPKLAHVNWSTGCRRWWWQLEI